VRAALATIVVAGALFVGMASGQGRTEGVATETGNDLPKLLIPHTPSSKNLPCSKCHRHLKPNREKRTLELSHTDITLRHAEEQRWCLDCHEGDKLRLPNGELIDYDRSHVLCGQCHGTVFRDWKVGIHGKRTGSWNGERYYRLCVSCHDAHRPKYKPIEPKPAPIRPADLKQGSRE
jgi:hypothetical protein